MDERTRSGRGKEWTRTSNRRYWADLNLWYTYLLKSAQSDAILLDLRTLGEKRTKRRERDARNARCSLSKHGSLPHIHQGHQTQIARLKSKHLADEHHRAQDSRLPYGEAAWMTEGLQIHAKNERDSGVRIACRMALSRFTLGPRSQSR